MITLALLIIAAQTAPIDYSKVGQLDGPTVNVTKVKVSRKVDKKVGKLISEGKCADAEAYALRKGRIELVPQVREICRPK